MDTWSFNMTKHAKLQIYQGIIQYLLDSTDYDLKNIAVLSNASIKMIRTIYDGHELPPNFTSSEKHLVQLYQMILELNLKQENNLSYLTKGNRHENIQHSTSC
jgi:hypothetical protein